MKQLIRYISLVVVCICTFLLSGCSFVWTTENGDPATPEDIKSSVEKEFAVVHPNLVLQSSVVEQEKPFQRNVYVFYDESNGLWYELQGDYYIPCLILSEEETQPIGLWGQRHKQYLKEHKQFLYTTMLIEGTLNSYLADIDRQAQERLLLLTKQIAEQENVTEKLKADNAMLWVQKMNEIQSRVREIIYSEIIYA